MTETKKNKIDNAMEAVIETSVRIRNYLLNESISDEEKTSKLKVLKTALESNKNIVSASCVLIHAEQLTK